MKLRLKGLLLLLASFCAINSGYACDLCNLYLSINPYDFKNSFSVNYRIVSASALYKAGPHFNSSRSSGVNRRHSSGQYFLKDTRVDERFQVVDLWGKYFVAKKLQLAINVPIEYNDYQYDKKVQTSVNGLGDISVLGIYQLHNTQTDTSNNFRQRVSVGGGVKLPTGNYKAMKNDELIAEDLQAGSGSVDVILLANYMARYKKVGISLLTSYKLNGQNKLKYSFANGINVTGNLFYQLPVLKKNAIIPDVGVYYEQAERDSKDGNIVKNTGGRVLFMTYGIKLVRMPFVLEMRYQKKIKETLNDSQMPNNDRYIIGLTYNFSSKFSY